MTYFCNAFALVKVQVIMSAVINVSCHNVIIDSFRFIWSFGRWKSHCCPTQHYQRDKSDSTCFCSLTATGGEDSGTGKIDHTNSPKIKQTLYERKKTQVL